MEAFWATWTTEVGPGRLGAAGRQPGQSGRRARPSLARPGCRRGPRELREVGGYGTARAGRLTGHRGCRCLGVLHDPCPAHHPPAVHHPTRRPGLAHHHSLALCAADCQDNLGSTTPPPPQLPHRLHLLAGELVASVAGARTHTPLGSVLSPALQPMLAEARSGLPPEQVLPGGAFEQKPRLLCRCGTSGCVTSPPAPRLRTASGEEAACPLRLCPPSRGIGREALDVQAAGVVGLSRACARTPGALGRVLSTRCEPVSFGMRQEILPGIRRITLLSIAAEVVLEANCFAERLRRLSKSPTYRLIPEQNAH